MLPVRFVTRIQDPWGWDKIGREYLRAFLEAGYPTRAVGSTLGDLDTPEWDALREAFPQVTGLGPNDLAAVNLDGDYLNVVCGFPDDFTSWWVAGRKNVAITACHPRPIEKESDRTSLAPYDLILTYPPDHGLVEMCLQGYVDPRKIEPCKAKASAVKFVLDRFLGAAT